MSMFDDNKELDIPDFVEDKDSTDSTSVDMSIFKMSDDELYDDVPKKTNEEKEPKKSGKKKSNATLLLCLILCAILLVVALVSGISAIKANGKISDYEAQVTALTAKNDELQNTINGLNGQIDALNKQLEEKGKADTETDPNNKYPKGTVLYITEEGNGMGVKEEASADSDFTDTTLYWGDEVKLIADATKDSSGNYWGKIEQGFIRIEYDGEAWASTEKQ